MSRGAGGPAAARAGACARRGGHFRAAPINEWAGAYPEGMSLSQPSRTIVVEPVQDAMGAPACTGAPPAPTGEASRRAESAIAPETRAQPAAKR